MGTTGCFGPTASSTTRFKCFLDPESNDGNVHPIGFSLHVGCFAGGGVLQKIKKKNITKG